MKKQTKTRETETKPEAPTRTLQVINQEYFQLCAQAGQIDFRIDETYKELTSVREKIRALSREAALIQAEEAAQKAREAQLEAAQKTPIEEPMTEKAPPELNG